MAKKDLSWLVGKLVTYFLLVVLFFIVTYPIYWTLTTSLKSINEIYKNSVGFVQDPTLENYRAALVKLDIGRYFLNSALISVLSLFGMVAVSAPAGYSFSRFNFKGSDLMFTLFLMGLALPAPAIMLSEYILLHSLHLLNTYHGIILFYMSLSAFGVIMFRNAFRLLPQTLVDAATIDGCGEFRLFVEILFPLVKPTTGTVIIFTYIFLWGDFVWPYILLRSVAKQTLTVALHTLFISFYGVGWGFLTAGLSIALLPTLLAYLALQHYFIKGITLGALKE